ncbi:MAG: Uma2 family endonuclease [Cyanobium sp.]
MTLATPPILGPETLPVPPILALPWDLQLTPEQFALVCAANPDAVLELAADGRLIPMTPTGGDTGARNNALLFQLNLALQGLPPCFQVFDSSTGFQLPDGAVVSPDAALVRLERWQALAPEQRRGFPPLCPDLVMELASESDAGPRGLEALRQKMDLYLRHGAQIGWLVLPQALQVEVWQAGKGDSVLLRQPASLAGSALHPDLVVNLEPFWTLCVHAQHG